MIPWIESHSIPVIFVLAFALCYLIAGVIYLAAVLMPAGVAADLKATSPPMLTPVAVIIGLLIGFLAARVWGNVDHAHAFLADEASALGRAVLFADSVGPEAGAAMRRSVTDYVRFVDAEDWPTMATGSATLAEEPPALVGALHALLAATPSQPGPVVAQRQAALAIEQALGARHGRILLSQRVISPLQWSAVLLQAALVMATVAMVHIDRRRTIAVNLFVYATGIAICLVLLLVNDRPFSGREASLPPAPLHDMVAGLH